ncbi:MAG: acyl-CoA dehydratase activase [Bacillota bacterium]
MTILLGIDVGSVSTNLVILDPESRAVVYEDYRLTQGNPIQAVQSGLETLRRQTGDLRIQAVGTTGSGRQLAAAIVGADSVKNEITAHAVAAIHHVPEVHTILEIGGQDSKLIILRSGIVTDFAMNTVCAAGTGSFLDRQAGRLGLNINEFGPLALQATSPVHIAGRCAVFAESDMIHKQQIGHPIPDILFGLCQALVRNFLNNLGKGKKIEGPVVFQGGVAANVGIRKAFEDALAVPVIVPEHFGVMGAIGAALLAQEATAAGGSSFRGWDQSMAEFTARSMTCSSCPNACEVVQISMNGTRVAAWGDRCGKWSYTGQAASR